jgi:hypothetical protein
MMWMALDEWISCASIAHIYGSGNEDDFSFINGKEYVRQVVIGNGVSAEIERTLGGCISRALPALAEVFRLPLAVSTLEQGLVSFFSPYMLLCFYGFMVGVISMSTTMSCTQS